MGYQGALSSAFTQLCSPATNDGSPVIGPPAACSSAGGSSDDRRAAPRDEELEQPATSTPARRAMSQRRWDIGTS